MKQVDELPHMAPSRCKMRSWALILRPQGSHGRTWRGTGSEPHFSLEAGGGPGFFSAGPPLPTDLLPEKGQPLEKGVLGRECEPI
jgi:hypothetical protein